MIFLILSTCFAAAQSAEEKKVAEAVEYLRQAMVSANEAALGKITAAELNYGHSSGKVENKTEFIAALTSGRSDFVTIELKEQTIQLTGSIAIVRHKLFAETFNDGVDGTTSLGILLIWQKQKNEWKLLARQAYKL